MEGGEGTQRRLTSVELHDTFDGMVWAEQFRLQFGPVVELDALHGWFANAIMAGHDYHANLVQRDNAAASVPEVEAPTINGHAVTTGWDEVLDRLRSLEQRRVEQSELNASLCDRVRELEFSRAGDLSVDVHGRLEQMVREQGKFEHAYLLREEQQVADLDGVERKISAFRRELETLREEWKVIREDSQPGLGARLDELEFRVARQGEALSPEHLEEMARYVGWTHQRSVLNQERIRSLEVEAHWSGRGRRLVEADVRCPSCSAQVFSGLGENCPVCNFAAYQASIQAESGKSVESVTPDMGECEAPRDGELRGDVVNLQTGEHEHYRIDCLCGRYIGGCICQGVAKRLGIRQLGCCACKPG